MYCAHLCSLRHLRLICFSLQVHTLLLLLSCIHFPLSTVIVVLTRLDLLVTELCFW